MDETTSEEKEQVERPSTPSEGAKMFRKEQAKTKPSEGNKNSETKKEVCETCEDEGKKPSTPKIRFVNEKGEDVPFAYEVDGKLIEVTDPDDLRTKAQFGHKGLDRFGELNRRDEAIATKEKEMEGYYKIIEPYARAAQEGKLKIVGEEKPEEKRPEEIEFADTEEEVSYLRKKLDEMSKVLEKQGKTIENQGRLITSKIIEEEYVKLDKELNGLKAEKYPLASIKDAWQNIADEPACTPEEAMKKSQVEREKDFSAYVEKHPEMKKMTDEQKQAAIQEYLADKEEKEKAPVGAPSVETAGGEGEQKPKISSPSQGAKLFFKNLRKAQEASKTS